MGYDELLRAIGQAEWGRAEDATLDLLHSGRFRDARDRAKTAIILAQARILGRLDARGAFTALLSALVDPVFPELEPAWLARTNVVSTLILTAPEASALTLEVSRRPAAAAERLPPHGDLRALAGISRLGGGVANPAADLVAQYFDEVAPSLADATEPVTRCLVLEARVAAAATLGAGGGDPRGDLEHALDLARSINFHAAEARLSLLAARMLPRGERESLISSAMLALRRGGIDAPWLLSQARRPS